MSETIETDFTPRPAAAAMPGDADASSAKDNDAAAWSPFKPDFLPYVEVAEASVHFMRDACENAVRTAVLVSVAGLECGAIWARGGRDIANVAATGVWRTGQISLGVSGNVMDRWMDLRVRSWTPPPAWRMPPEA